MPDLENRDDCYKSMIKGLWRNLETGRIFIKIEIFHENFKFNFNGFTGFSLNYNIKQFSS